METKQSQSAKANAKPRNKTTDQLKKENERMGNEILRHYAKMGDHNSKVILAYRMKYNTEEKREAKRAEMIAQWLEREGVERKA